MELAQPIAALFDLDGVLIDSEGLYTDFWTAIDRQYPTGIHNFAHFIKGSTLQHILAKHFPDPVISSDVVRQLDLFELNIKYPVFAGARQLLSELRSKGIKTALVTSSSAEKMDSLLRQLPDFTEMFDTVVTGADVTHSKPNPEGYLLAAQRLGCAPECCFVFEDSLQGLQAGMDSGATVIGLATTNPRDKIIGRAHLVIDSLDGFTADMMLAAKERKLGR